MQEKPQAKPSHQVHSISTFITRISVEKSVFKYFVTWCLRKSGCLFALMSLANDSPSFFLLTFVTLDCPHFFSVILNLLQMASGDILTIVFFFLLFLTWIMMMITYLMMMITFYFYDFLVLFCITSKIKIKLIKFFES